FQSLPLGGRACLGRAPLRALGVQRGAHLGDLELALRELFLRRIGERLRRGDACAQRLARRRGLRMEVTARDEPRADGADAKPDDEQGDVCHLNSRAPGLTPARSGVARRALTRA